jgi:hypothetical protein
VQGAGGRQDGGGLAEAQSFTDLLYSKNKVGGSGPLRGTASLALVRSSVG